MAIAVVETSRTEEVLRQQHVAIVGFGRHVLGSADIGAAMTELAGLVARTLDVECCHVMELLPGAEALVLRAGTGGDLADIGRTPVASGLHSPAGFTLLLGSDQPLVVGDLASESRFRVPDLYRRPLLVSGVSVIVAGRTQPWGVLAAYSTRARAFTADDTQFLRAMANALAAALALADAEEGRDEAAVREQAARLQATELATHRERVRVAGELHDTLSQMLFSVALKLEWCLSHLPDVPEVRDKLEEIRHETGFMMAQIRRLIAKLSPETTSDSFVQRVQTLLRQFRELTGATADLIAAGDLRRLDPRREEVLQKTFQEGLANIAKHARATEVTIRVEVENGAVRFEVTDNGVGLAGVADSADLFRVPGHFGLRQMAERIEALDGRISLATAVPSGFRLSGTIPLEGTP
jgi:signal transduction histidine kinase